MQPGQSVIGYYALDLTDANKGKMLEPVRVTRSTLTSVLAPRPNADRSAPRTRTTETSAEAAILCWF
jgi:hypothetical protein